MRFEDESEIFAPSIYIRVAGTSEYLSYELKTKDGQEYEARIPGNQVMRNLEYFIEAFDAQGNGPSREGTPEAPLPIVVYDPLAPVPKDEEHGIIPQPPDDSEERRGVTGQWWFWTIVGVAVAGGVTTAILLSGGGTPDFVDVDVRGPDPVGTL